MTRTEEAVVSWALFRVLESLNLSMPDIEAAKTFALDGVNFIMHDVTLERFMG